MSTTMAPMLRQIAILLTGLLLGSAAAEDKYDVAFREFKAKYGKSYAPKEDRDRFEIFKENLQFIDQENTGDKTYTVAVNEFAAHSSEEFRSARLGLNPSLRKTNLESVPWRMPNLTAPASIDWVQKGGVTPVKNQASCGSCWAFSTTGAVEGAYFAAAGKLVSLSEQDLVSCDSIDHGCRGGAMDNGFDFAKKYGLCTEEDYRYSSGGGKSNQCSTKCAAAVTVTGHTDVPANDETALKAAVAMQPVSVAIEADQRVFQLYSHGILNNPACGTNLDHGVLVVGYGTEDGQDYWKVKNSWGGSWGEEGFIRIARGSNMCGIAMDASYPTGAKAAGDLPKPPVPSPAPTPAPGATTHYEDPKEGCQADEKAISIQGIAGAMCSPKCIGSTTNGMTCPTDVPTGAKATPQCALKTTSGDQYCALICDPGADDNECGDNASCKPTSGLGICTYDDDVKATMSVKFDLGSDIIV